jgi:hypothetical protein
MQSNLFDSYDQVCRTIETIWPAAKFLYPFPTDWGYPTVLLIVASVFVVTNEDWRFSAGQGVEWTQELLSYDIDNKPDVLAVKVDANSCIRMLLHLSA